MRAELTVDLGAIAKNWQRLDGLSAPATETAAVVKADGYGLGAAEIAASLQRRGVRTYFVALAEEGARVRDAVGGDAEIFVLSGYLPSDGELVARFRLIPVINSAGQFRQFATDFPGHSPALQLDTGMNRLGLEAGDFRSVGEALGDTSPCLLMSHLACADDPHHPLNRQQLAGFRELAAGIDCRLSLAATGGILLGDAYHFDLCRAGIGLYGGLPFADAESVVTLDIPVIQVRQVHPGEIVGYGATWTADRPTRVATLSAGYADGIFRLLGDRICLHASGVPCRGVGRISMDLIGVDVSHLDEVPDRLQLLGADQSIDNLAESASTIGYEVLTSLGGRYDRRYTNP